LLSYFGAAGLKSALQRRTLQKSQKKNNEKATGRIKFMEIE
jgi:hypothetical protein